MRTLHKLTAKFCAGNPKPGRHSDGGNLFLEVSAGRKSWVFNYARDGRERSMGLGAFADVPLALARELATAARVELAKGNDPIDTREAKAAADRAERARLITFKELAIAYHTANAHTWNNDKHRKEWLSTVRRFAFPLLGNLWISDLTVDLVCKVLEPLIEAGKHVTAARLRGRIEAVFDAGKVRGSCSGDNPAAPEVIGKAVKLKSEKAGVQHQPALPYAKVAAFMTAVRTRQTNTARCLEMLVLSGMRLNAVRPALKSEIDLNSDDGPVWVIPAVRMKQSDEDHRIPLGARGVAIVTELLKTPGPLLFPGEVEGKPVGRNPLDRMQAALLKEIGHDGRAVKHGFRSALDDWARETTDHRWEVVEKALGHKIPDSVRRAYSRGEFMARRRAMMDHWESHCAGNPAPAGNVVPINTRTAA